jgi:hypothetical protein
MGASPKKILKTIACPWDVAYRIAASADGSLVVASGQLSQIAAVDQNAWQIVPWPKLEKHSVNTLDILPDGRLVAVSVAGVEESRVEIRDRSGTVTAYIPTPNNARACWAADGELLVAVIEPHVDDERAHLAFLRPNGGRHQPIKTVPIDGAAAAFVGYGSTVLAFVRTLQENIREQYRFLRIDRKGRVEDRGATTYWDAPLSVTAVGTDRALVCGYNHGWRLIRVDDLEVIAEGPYTFAVRGACVHDKGFVVANGTDVRCHDLKGKLVSKKKSKARVNGLAVAGGVIFAQLDGRPTRIELIPL